jgi:hypothetical protein
MQPAGVGHVRVRRSSTGTVSPTNGLSPPQLPGYAVVILPRMVAAPALVLALGTPYQQLTSRIGPAR